ncbi:MAG TPA: toll/interleukin-1 receptor domain-containing protein [Rubrivivax sp.]|nr:toll/interleukin-1 receptor domain-containing protein [Rubrivivax sp.]HPO19557.1 toll/interleukin-1 receptor domain-containing protein [Rubrivivax sp.]
MRIFLSHASPSKARVVRLTEPLPPHVQVWLDRDALAAGQRFAPRIEAAIRRDCDFVLVFIDEHALASDWVRRETALALQRQADLQRAFVLPVLLQPLGVRMAELGIDPEQMLYIDATDASDEGIARAAALLGAELFKHCSRMIETLRNTDRRAMLDALSAEVTEYQQVAFRWQASMGNSLAVLSTNQAAFDHVRDTLAAYNEVSERFIPRLALHRDRITAAWRERRSLCEDVREVLACIDHEVYRGAMFALNEVIEAIHHLDAAGGAPAAELAALDARKDTLNAAARDALEAMSARSAELIGDLESELEP